MAKLIPDRGAWMEFETRKNDYIILKFNREIARQQYEFITHMYAGTEIAAQAGSRLAALEQRSS
jgi:hypothetical protein